MGNGAKPRPWACLEDNPTPQSVYFCGLAINLKEMSRLYGMDHGYLSKIFSFQRVPSGAYLKKIGEALHMTKADLLIALELEETESQLRRA